MKNYFPWSKQKWVNFLKQKFKFSLSFLIFLNFLLFDIFVVYYHWDLWAEIKTKKLNRKYFDQYIPDNFAISDDEKSLALVCSGRELIFAIFQVLKNLFQLIFH